MRICSNAVALAFGFLVVEQVNGWTTTTTTTSSSLLAKTTTTLKSTITAPVPFGMTPPRAASSALQMGMFEDMLTGADDATRAKENAEFLSKLQKRVTTINNMEADIEDLEDDELQAKTKEFQQRLKNGEDINGKILEESFAVVREAAWRVLELRHYDVQILGGLVLHEGRLAEMATGEGKTLAATLPTYANALTGTTSFVVTVNDYLARRDMEKMGQVHRFLGLTVGLIQSGMAPEQRREQYDCDIVYVTNSELGFDYLRDNLALSPLETVNRESSSLFDGFCLVDEADSVLIDEARTPLIISKQVPAPGNKYRTANKLATALKETIHYTVDLKNKNCILTETGYIDSQKALGVDNLFEINKADGQAWAPFVSNAVKAKELFTKDIEYTVLTNATTGEKNGIGIIDSFTGRVLDGRRWSDGLHQSIEAIEGIDVSQQSQVIAKVTYQSLFRQFKRLAGMTGTATADAGEMETTYGLRVTPVPTALPIARRDYEDVVFKTREAANRALIKEVLSVGGYLVDSGTGGGMETNKDPKGRPCLIGTTSVMQSETIVAALAENGIKAELLNASPENAPRESEIVAQAGRAGVVTVATNIAGRGTDILLGGCATTMSRIKTRSVLLQEQVVPSAIELKSLPPSPEEDYFPCSITDECNAMLKSAAASIKKEFGDTNEGKGLDAIAFDEMLTVAFDTTEAEDDPEYIVELRNAASAVKEIYEPILAEEKERVRSLGGLYVMGTNRHESSRIDSQLRGRSGRQGDPGSSRFFLSFKDDMFVIFGGDSLDKILTTFRVSEDMPVEAPQVTEALDKVQRQVEEKYRDIRKEIFQFDEVLDGQRRVIYGRRRNALNLSDNEALELMKSYNEKSIADIVKGQTSEDGKTDYDKLLTKLGQFFPPVLPLISKDELSAMKSTDDISTYLNVVVDEWFKAKSIALDAIAKKEGSLGRSGKYIALVTLDNAWSTHLQCMENLKEAVVLRQYQGLDPVQEYRNEAFDLFEGLEDTIRLNSVYSLWQSLATA